MNMYVDLLSRALDGGSHGMTGPELVRHARTCRDVVARPGAYGGMATADTLAAEIAYDRSLVWLCDLHAIPVDTRQFLSRTQARRQLEAQLHQLGISLDLAEDDGGHASAFGGDTL